MMRTRTVGAPKFHGIGPDLLGVLWEFSKIDMCMDPAEDLYW